MTKDHRKENQQVPHEGKPMKNYYHQWIHDLAEWWNLFGMRLLICKCKRAFLITDGSVTRLTLTLAPMGMVAPWRCQEHRRPSSLIHWAWSQKYWKTDTMQTDTDSRLRLRSWNKTKPYTYHLSFIAFTLGPELQWLCTWTLTKNNMVYTMMVI